MAMQLRELDVLQKTSSLHDVWEAAESIVEVLKSWPKNFLVGEFTFWERLHNPLPLTWGIRTVQRAIIV